MDYAQALEAVRIRRALRDQLQGAGAGAAELIDRLERIDPAFFGAECRRWRARFAVAGCRSRGTAA